MSDPDPVYGEAALVTVRLLVPLTHLGRDHASGDEIVVPEDVAAAMVEAGIAA